MDPPPDPRDPGCWDCRDDPRWPHCPHLPAAGSPKFLPCGGSPPAPGDPRLSPASPRSRIYEILPQRIQQWQQSPCVAEEHGKRLLERIRREQHQARLRLQEMERRFHELEGLIARAKGHPPREDEEVGPRPPPRDPPRAPGSPTNPRDHP